MTLSQRWGRLLVSINYALRPPATPRSVAKPTVTAGVDLGVRTLATVATIDPTTGVETLTGYPNPAPLRVTLTARRRAGRELSRRIPGSRGCDMCKERVFSHCLADEGASGIGWIFGHLIDGTQAEYVRVPFAETSVYPLPDGVTPQEGAMLSDILPTGHEIGVRYGQVKVGDVVVVIGAGPVGLAAIMTARLYGPSKIVAVDLDANRVEQAKRFGATHGVLSSDADWKDQVMALTDGLGVDVAIEAVGIPRTFEMCYQVVRPAGHIANVGVHGTGVWLPLDTLWISNITIAMGLVNTDTTATLLKMVAEHTLPADLFVSHTFDLDGIEEAYDVFGRAADTHALKVALNA